LSHLEGLCFFTTLKPSSLPPPSIDEGNVEITATSETVKRHVRGWEQILNMLRGTVGVEVYDSDDDEHHETDEELADEDLAA